jgi:hypothetical protein
VSEGPGEPSFADVLNGISGGAGKRRERRGLFRRRRDEAQADGEERRVDRFPVSEPYPAQVPTSPYGRHEVGVVPPGSQEETPPWGLDRHGPVGGGHAAHEHDADDGEDEASFVRPYAWTGGRTRPAYELAIETLISLGPQGRDPNHIRQYEHRAVADLCREPRSVAEVAALLKLPLGVARVLLGDMASQGTVVVHQTASTSEEGPDRALMERVLSGLRRL